MTVLLDTHVVHWWSSEPERLSEAATRVVEGADELAVSGVTWFELAWLARRERITLTVPVSSWLAELAADVRTVPVTWRVAHTAASLPGSFPSDPADRVIYATALEHGWPLVTKDGRMRDHAGPTDPTVW
ncbi:MAG: type II toxin-antitoxin system VapC family toxin [Kineosporiaceae bacterium]